MMDYPHGRGFRYDDGWFGHGFTWLGSLLFVVLVAALVALGVWLVNRTRRTGIDDPLRHAAARYADGKIGRVEFERIQADLAAAGLARPPASPLPPAENGPAPDQTTSDG